MPAKTERYIVKGPCSEEWLNLCKELPEAASMGDARIGDKEIKAPKLLAKVKTKKELAKIIVPKGSKIMVILHKGSCYKKEKCKICKPSCGEWETMEIISRQEIVQT